MRCDDVTAEYTSSVLLVDDEAPVRASLRRSLRGEPYEILEADSGAAALAILKARPVDLVLADHLMPGMTGLDFLRAARVLRPESVRIMLTGNGTLDIAMRAINEDAIYRFLMKPWDPGSMRAILRLALRHAEAERRNNYLLELGRREACARSQLERAHPGLLSVDRDEDGAIILPEMDL